MIEGHRGPEPRATVRETLRTSPYPAWRLGHVLRGWRAADQVLRRSEEDPVRAAYERAVALALEELACFGSVEELLVHHAQDRHRRFAEVGDPPPGTVEAWLEAVCRAAAPDQPLERSLVEGAAFWRRAVQLLGAPDR
ncbi:MAG TPA: hypothetical protein VG370_22385 [Chloroflexota bacterium]|jgi:hypothetical protein|nr:hypothetical protein [Chloroflexota bacterium]